MENFGTAAAGSARPVPIPLTEDYKEWVDCEISLIEDIIALIKKYIN